MLEFDDETCEKLFGADDAENESPERFKQYFYYNRTYENLISNLPIRILVGPKGVGKSALLHRAHLNDLDHGILSIWLQPKELMGMQSDESFVLQIENWKKYLLEIIGKNILAELRRDAQSALPENIVFPTSVGKWLDFITDKVRTHAEKMADGANETFVNTFLTNREIKVYIDDIDRGWSASYKDIQSISALLNAIRDLCGEDARLKFRIALRSDVYFLVRTSDESTDKIESHVVWLAWENHEILCVMAKRIETFFNTYIDEKALFKMYQHEISQKILSKVIEPIFHGRGHWSNRPIHNVLLSLTRKRPRDLVKLMRAAAKNAYTKGHSQITSSDLETTFESYSNLRLQDIINEYRSELPQIEALVLGMKPTSTQRAAKENFTFTTDALITKIKNIMSQHNFIFKNGRPVTAKALIQFLYKIEFITARLDKPDGMIERRFFDQSRFLASEIADFGYNWEIHPAYRWALQPQDIHSILEGIALENAA